MPQTSHARYASGSVLLCLLLGLSLSSEAISADASATHRMTPMVKAVQRVRPSVVNIQGKKTVTEASAGVGSKSRQVNGMGTGVVIDPRGYILTNHHVVDGVKQINVTFADRRAYIAEVVAFNHRTDLAVIKINTTRDLPVVPIGTSSDLMPAETVIAVGNAYGYENTVTVGIISALHRDVQVSDTQAYDDLIQTDASINPGNSGGPLLNIDGEMIGLNVAVRAGAQGIGFAIPVDSAMEIAASLMSIEEIEHRWHGLQAKSIPGRNKVVVERVESGSPAAKCGIQSGDVITRIGDLPTHRKLDIERALLGLGTSNTSVTVERSGEVVALDMSLSTMPNSSAIVPLVDTNDPATGGDTRAWEALGVALEVEPRSSFRNSKYQGGLRVVDVRKDSPADRGRIRPGDILVGMHRYQTASMKDVDYIINRSNIPKMGDVRFYIVRGSETLYGDINVASNTSRSTSGKRRF